MNRKSLSLHKIPLSTRILVSMFIGLVAGVYTPVVYPGIDMVANAFVALLQMTALPYIALSLIVGIGGLSPLKARALLKHSVLILFILTAIVLLFILVAPTSFPNWENAEFYSANTVHVQAELDLVALFIPENPFNAFANALIPAVVTFSVLVGIGLMAVKEKETTLHLLDGLRASIANVAGLIMRFAPLGVFCIALSATATIDSSQVDGLVVYIFSSVVLVALLAFAVLPAAVAMVSPFTYAQILKVSREAMITAFATGSFFAVIPIVVEKSKVLIAQLEPVNGDAEETPDIIVPISYSLPVGGKLLALLFTLFAAWFSGAFITTSDYANLILVGVPHLFGTTTLAMPRLLELFNVSGAMFDFFLIAENLIIGRLSALLSVIFSICLVILIACKITKKLHFSWPSIGRFLIIVPLLSLTSFSLLRFGFSEMSHQYQGYDKFIQRDFLLGNVESFYRDEAEQVDGASTNFSNGLKRIQQRGFLRVGYFRDGLPYSFNNNQGKLVGFDIEIMNQLALDLNVDVEYVKIFHDQAAPMLDSGYLDITAGIPVIPDNMKDFTLTVPYSTQPLVLVVKDERRGEFKYWQDIKARHDLTIGIPETFFYTNAIKRYFIHGEAWEISSPRLFFRPDYEHIDAMLLGSAAASAWTLLYPEFTVVVPSPALPSLAMAFPISKNDHELELFMRNWIEMKKQDKVLEFLFDYWISNKKPNDLELERLSF